MEKIALKILEHQRAYEVENNLMSIKEILNLIPNKVMNNTKSLCEIFIKKGINFFAGVPDSLLAEFSNELENKSEYVKHLICPNEGLLLQAAMGYYSATKIQLYICKTLDLAMQLIL